MALAPQDPPRTPPEDTTQSAGRGLPVQAEIYRTPLQQWMQEPEAATVPLSHYLWIIGRHRWQILAFVAVCVAAAYIVTSRITPLYESVTTIDIDRQMPAGVIGQEATRAATNDSDQFLATQVRLIQSDSVLRPVAQRYNLIKDEGREERRASPADVANAPIVLEHLKVTRPPNTYLLLVAYRSPDPKLAADVANAVANSYLEHTYLIRIRSSSKLSTFMEKQLEELRAKMETSSQKLAQFERDLNVINPEEKTNILSARLLQLNTEYTAAQGERVRKQAAFESIRLGSLEAAQVSSQGESLKRISERLDEAQQKFAWVKSQYGPNHPEYKRAALQLSGLNEQLKNARDNTARRVEVEYLEATKRELMLRKAVAETKAEYDRLNARSFEYQALKREAAADKTLYEELVRKIKEAGINAGFQNSTIRLADPARPALHHVFPNKRLNVLLAFMFSTLLALGVTILADTLNNTVRDPAVVMRELNTDVLGALPVVKEWRGHLLPSGLGFETANAIVPASKTGRSRHSGYQEAIRTLRNSILLGDFDRRIRSLQITSCAPMEGKSTIAATLASVHAQQGHKTLLIDCDQRRPSVHKAFACTNTQGLSDVLTGTIGWRDALATANELPHLDLLFAGPHLRRSLDLLGSSIGDILDEACREYDLVILDSPPLLGFPEPLQIAAAADAVLLVTLAGETSRKALHIAVSTLARVRAHLLGIVMNKMAVDGTDGYYYSYYYPSHYKHYDVPVPPKG